MLRKCRLAYCLKQQDVATLLGVQVTDRISQWERGRAMPNLVNLFKLCAIYGKLPHELYPDLIEAVREGFNYQSPDRRI